MNEMPKVNRSDAVAEVRVQWSKYKAGGNHAMQPILDKIQKKLTELGHGAADDDCTYVYYGCGSCGGNSAVVAAYCGGGGADPDYWWCEPC
jgi:hypothetical protein